MTLKYEDYEKDLCTKPGCFNVRYGRKKICKTHYNREWLASQSSLTCTRDGCNEPRNVRGLCLLHKPRCIHCGEITREWHKVCRWHEDNPSYTRKFDLDESWATSDIEQIDKYVPRGLADDACWPWQGRINQSGYGYAYDADTQRAIGAHRFVYEMFGFDIPESMALDHTCRNKACVNPQHLEVVTKGENTRRMSKHWSQFDECITEGCTFQGVARGKCARCYSVSCPEIARKWQRGMSFEDYINVRIRKHEDGCWDWIGKINIGVGTANLATPQVHWEGKTSTAYREIYKYMNAAYLTPDQTLDHLCRNRICVNPEHLEVVTIQENQRRRWEADRARKQLEEGEKVA